MFEKPDRKPKVQTYPDRDPYVLFDARIPMTANQADELRRKNPPKPVAQTTEDKAVAMVHGAGLPKAAAAIVRRLLLLEDENVQLHADFAVLQKRLAALESKKK